GFARPPDVRVRRGRALQASHARSRGGPHRQGLLPRFPAGPERGGSGRVAAGAIGGVKLVTFGSYDRVGFLDHDEIVVLDVQSMRELFEDGGADETGERIALEDTFLRPPIFPKKFFHTAGK